MDPISAPIFFRLCATRGINWAAVLEVASDLMKQMINLPFVKSLSLGQGYLQLAACTMVGPKGQTWV